MDQSGQLVVGRAVKVTELLVTNRRLQCQSLGDVRFRVDVLRGVVFFSRGAVGEAAEAVGA